MLHGPETSTDTLLQIRDAIDNERPIRCEMLNYTKAKTPYWIELNLSPFLLMVKCVIILLATPLK
jgi:hypothetical protein